MSAFYPGSLEEVPRLAVPSRLSTSSGAVLHRLGGRRLDSLHELELLDLVHCVVGEEVRAEAVGAWSYACKARRLVWALKPFLLATCYEGNKAQMRRDILGAYQSARHRVAVWRVANIARRAAVVRGLSWDEVAGELAEATEAP